MVDVNKIDAETLAKHLRSVEPELTAQVNQEKLGVLCAGACHDLQNPAKGRGR